MGIDVVLFTAADVTDEELAQANEYFCARVPPVPMGSTFTFPGDTEPTTEWGGLHRNEYEDDDGNLVELDRIYWRSFERYYGPGYERGDWGHIRMAAQVMRAAFPGDDVFYGGDSDDNADLVDDDFLAAMDEHFLSKEGLNYRFGWGAEDTAPSPLEHADIRAAKREKTRSQVPEEWDAWS